MVVFYHYAFFIRYAAAGKVIIPYPWLATYAKYGYLGVDLFFIISGFVVFMGTASMGSPQRFLMARIVRLYPVFLVCCSITFLVTALIGAPYYTVTFRQFIANLTMLSGFFGVDAIDGVYWTLFIVIQFYFIVFVMLALRIGRYWEAFLGLCLPILLILIIAHVKWVNGSAAIYYAPHLVVGAMCYVIYDRGINWHRALVTGFAAICAVLVAVRQTSWLSSHFAMPFSPAISAIIVASFVLIVFFISVSRAKWLSSPKWLLLGGITYPLYLIHAKVGSILFYILSPYLNIHLLLWAIILAVLLFAYSIHMLERKYLNPYKSRGMRSAEPVRKVRTAA